MDPCTNPPMSLYFLDAKRANFLILFPLTLVAKICFLDYGHIIGEINATSYSAHSFILDTNEHDSYKLEEKH